MNEKEYETLTDWAEAAQEAFGNERVDLYGLPDNLVCAFDIVLVDGFRLKVTNGHGNDREEIYNLRLRIDTGVIHDWRITIKTGLTKRQVEAILGVLVIIDEKFKPVQANSAEAAKLEQGALEANHEGQ